MNLQQMKLTSDESFEFCDKIKNQKPTNDADKLSKWILNTDVNVYDILLDTSDAVMCSHINGLACLLTLIHHGIMDDGEISFVTMKGKPLIVRQSMYNFTNKKEFFEHLNNIQTNFKNLNPRVDFEILSDQK